MNQNNTYRTSDTSLSAYLVTIQFALLYVDYGKPRFEFVFPGSDKIQMAARNYLSGNAHCEPSALIRVNRKLLRIIRKRCQWEDD